MENFREFSCGPDAFGRTWQVWFKWLQTAISIRHSDSVDVKFILRSDDETQQKTISMPHLTLRNLAKHMGISMSDAWCSRLARQHLEYLISSSEDMEKDIVTPSPTQLAEYAERGKKLGDGAGLVAPWRSLARIEAHAGRFYYKAFDPQSA